MPPAAQTLQGVVAFSFLMEVFNGTHFHYISTVKPGIRKASRLASTAPNQIFAHCIAPHEAAALLPDYEKLEFPPDFPAGHDPTQMEMTRYWREHDAVLRNEQEFNQFYIWLVNHLSTDVQALISSSANTAFDTLTLRDICEHLENLYGTPHDSSFREVDLILDTRFHLGDNFVDHMARFNQALDYFANMNRPKDHYEKYHLLSKSFSDCKEYHDLIRIYELGHPSHNAVNYTGLVKLLITHSDDLRVLGAASLNQASRNPSLLNKRNRPPPTQSNRGVFNSNLEAPNQYCWTHGYGFHASSACKSPITGHCNDATWSNTKGGNTVMASSRTKRN